MNEKMNFMEAIKAMREGKKVRRAIQMEGNYCELDDNALVFMDFGKKNKTNLPVEFFEGTDFEIFEDETN